MGRSSTILVVFLVLSVYFAIAQKSKYVCYTDPSCGVGVERPVFYIGSSVDDCCVKPGVISVFSSVSNEPCSNCTQSAERITPLHVALYPPADLELEVAATGYTVISWLINGTVMHDFDRLKLENNNKKFILSNTTEEDYGTYTADIYTSQEEVIMIDFHVFKYVSPTVYLSVPSEDDIINGLVNITCTSNGNPLPEVILFCDDIATDLYLPVKIEETFNIVPSIRQTASVPALKANGLKACHCNASAFDGANIEMKTTSVLLLATPPTITSREPAEEYSITAPLKVDLSCTAKGRSLPNITWYKNGAELQSDSHIALNTTVNGFMITSTVKILPSSSKDYGRYYCTAVNQLGAVNSTAVLINVQFPPNVTTATPIQNINYNNQKEATLSCKAKGNPEPQIIWLGDGGILNDECGEDGVLANVFGEAAFDYGDFYSGNAEEDSKGYVPSNCEITFTKDNSTEGVVIITSSLTIKNLHQERSSSFKCISENSIDNMIGAKQHITLELKLDGSPYFLRTPLESYNETFETSSHYICDVIGQSATEVSWLKNGIHLQESDPSIMISSSTSNVENSTSVITNSSLFILSIDADDAGIYTCQAVNSNGTSQYNFTVDIYSVLLIHDSLQTFSPFIEGDTLVLSCNTTGPASTNVTWTHKGTPLIEDERTTVTLLYQLSNNVSYFLSKLIIEDLQLSDNGSYVCVATDGIAEAEQEIGAITVHVPVSVAVYPEVTVHRTNTKSTINCTSSGVPAPFVEFINSTCQKDQMGEAEEDQNSDNSFIVFCMSEKSNDGLITVTASAEINNTDFFGVIELFCSSYNDISEGNASAEITIQASPMINSPAVGNIGVNINEPFTLTCSANGYPRPELSWRNSNGQLSNGTDVTIVVTVPQTLSNGLQLVESTLTVSNTGLDYNGSYLCVVSSEAGVSERHIATINVQVPIAVSVSPKTVVHTTTTNASTINCTASGIPEPILQFINISCMYESDQQIGEADEDKSSGQFTVFCDSPKQSNGLYVVTAVAMIRGTDVELFGVMELVCVSTNTISTSNDTGYVIVKANPKITSSNLGTLKILEGENFSLTCASIGYPVPSISWTRNEKMLTGLSNNTIATSNVTTLSDGMQHAESTLTVTNATADDEGLYTCISQNDVGTAKQAAANVDIKALPQLTDLTPSTLTHVVGDNTTIRCTGQGDPPPSVIFHGIECAKYSSSEGKVSSDGAFVGQCSSAVVKSGIIETTVSLSVSNSSSLLGPVQLNCSANSSLGETSPEYAVVYLTGPPTVVGSPSAVTVEYGHPTVIVCTATGYPVPTISWAFRNQSQVLQSDITISVSGYTNQSTLMIPKSYPSDEGTYICTANNAIYGFVSILVQVSVSGVSPTILSDDRALTLIVGSNLVLSCNASGLPAPTITWLKYDDIIAGSGSDLLLQLGSGSGPFEGKRLEEDEFNITTSNTSGLNGDQVVHTFSELTITGISLLSEGTYSCVANNNFGKDSKPIGKLVVQEPPSISLSHQSVVHTVPGEGNTVIFCTGTGKPAPTVTFGGLECSGKDNASETEGISIQCGSSVVSEGLYHLTVIITLTESISTFGKLSFTCSAENGVLSTAMGRTNVTVEVKKSVSTSPKYLSVNEEDSFDVFCDATSHPLPSLDWLFGEDSTSIIENERISIDFEPVNAYIMTSTLSVKKVLPDDKGEYKCRAQSNGIIISSTLVQVIEKDECTILAPCVHGTCIDRTNDYFCDCDDGYEGVKCDIALQNITVLAPTLTEDPQNITMADLLASFNLTCKASENPIYLWFRDGELIHNDTDPVLVITEVDPSDRGYYVCQAINSAGNTTSEPGLVIIEGVYQYAAELDGDINLVVDNGTLNSQIGECLASESLAGVNSTIIYSVEFCVGRRGCQNDGVAAILLTVYQRISPSTSSGIHDALERKLGNLAAECSLKINVTDLWRFDGCRETKEVFHEEYRLSILWPESEIQDQVTKPCPCGTLTSSVYTNGTASRVCGGDYTDGGQWFKSNTSACEYNVNNINITLTLCHLTNVGDTKNIAETLESVTAESTLFEPLDLTIASLVLEMLVESEDLRVDRELQESFVQTISNLLLVDTEVAARSEGTHQSTSRILNAVNTFQQKIVIQTNQEELFMRKTQFAKEKVGIVVLETNSSEFRNLTLLADLEESLISSADELIVSDQQRTHSSFNVSLFLPDTLADETNLQPDSTLRVGYALLLGNVLFQGGSDSELGSQIASGNLTLGPTTIAANLFNVEGEIAVQGTSSPVVIQFRKPEYLSANKTKSLCVFWNENRTGSNGWSSDGCVEVPSDDEEIVRCECDHLTHFGYLLDVQPQETEPEDFLALEIVIFALCTLSVVCLLIIIVTYGSSKKLHGNVQGKTLINMSVALIGVYVTYAIAVNAKSIRGAKGIRGDILCGFIGALLYYFILVYFMWTGLEAVDLYRKLVKVFNKKSPRFVLYGGMVSWGTPLIITAVAAIAGREDYIKYEFFCRPVSLSFYIGFLFPFGLIYAFNWVLFIIIILSLVRRRSEKNDYQSRSAINNKKIFFVAMILSFNFGLGWIFGLLVTSKIPRPLYITFLVLFSLFVGLQGVLVFILHGARNQNARKIWQMWVFVICCCQTKRDAKVLAKLTFTPAATPAANRRRNLPASLATESSQLGPPISPLAKKYFTATEHGSEKEGFTSPINESDTLDTYLGSHGFEMIDLGSDHDEKEKLESRPEKKSFLKRLSKLSVGQLWNEVKERSGSPTIDELDEEGTNGKASGKQSKKSSLRISKSKKTSKDLRELVSDDFGGSTYSLGGSEYESQAVEIHYKPDPAVDEDSDNDSWVQQQMRDITYILNSNFAHDTNEEETSFPGEA